MARRKDYEIWGADEIDKFLEGLPAQFGYKFVQDTYSDTLRATMLRKAKKYAGERNKDTVRSDYKSRAHAKGTLKRSIAVIRGKNKKKRLFRHAKGYNCKM